MTRPDLVTRYTAVFDEVGAEAITRERERRQPYAEVDALRDSGFTRVTLPVAYGGDGATHDELFELLAELARRDSNLAQLLRSHFSFIDRLIHAPDSPARTTRLSLLAEGAIHGNATFERSTAKVGEYSTRVTRDATGLRLDGRKFYSTGTLFADLVSVAAEWEGKQVSVLLRTDAPGLTREDDWAGFGQRMTGSGTTILDAVRITEDDIVEFDSERPSHGGAFVQLVLLAVVTGIGRAIVDDAARFVRTRTRTYSHSTAATAQEDPIVQETVGELSALSFAADGALARAVTALQRASDAELADAPVEQLRSLIADADVATARAQLVVLPSVLSAATELFEVGGASATDIGLALDRHWRNARTVASHNPARYKARALGDQLVNGTPVVSWWTSGEA
jgi:alkylation response protein AidB-like acyl-CoA dehydrogenase